MTKVGLFGIGLNTYWDQFDGLLENIENYQQQIKTKIENFGVEVIDAGIVDNVEKARDAADLLKNSDIEIVFLYISTYALSSTVHHLNNFIKKRVITPTLKGKK